MGYKLHSEKLERITSYPLPRDVDAGIARTLSSERPLQDLDK